ncbi:MAG: hypothetical protein KJ773_03275, partial [Candidatus Thermoplasmatota archaeon]|nr:hypothetical protein [Candidatus Thermoplasmatota archaeon]
MTDLFPISIGLKYSKKWGEYHPGLHTIYVKNDAMQYDFPVVWFEEMIHRSCFDYTWLKYRFPYAIYERIIEFQNLVQKAKEKGISLNSPLRKGVQNYPEDIFIPLKRIYESYEVDTFYLKSIDPFFHALFFRIFENLNKESYSTEEIAEADGQYMNVPEGFRDFVRTISPHNIDGNKVIYYKYKTDAFSRHKKIKEGYEKLIEIEESIPNPNNYNKIICYIMNPTPIIPPLIASPKLTDVKDSPKYNAQKRFEIISEIVKSHSEGEEWASMEEKIEKECQDTFLESLSRPREIEMLLKAYSKNIPEKEPTRLFSVDDFNLLVLYPPYIHSTQLEGDDMP